MKKTFSVIIPLYNKGPYVVRAITSVLQQTYDNFEIIIVNDGSTDDGPQKVLAVNDPRIKLVSQQNSGVSAARNRGAEEAGGKYLAFLDADDTWDKDFLREMSLLINAYPNAGIYASNNYFHYPHGKLTANEISEALFPGESGIMKDYFRVFAELQRSPFSNSNIVIPAEIYHKMGGYKEGVRLTEDSDLWCRIALEHEVVFTKKPLSTYYLAVEGSTHTIFENKEYEVSKTLKNIIENKKLDPHKTVSVRKLIALQDLGLIKRGILTGNNRVVLPNLFNTKIIRHYPIEYVKCLFAIIIPSFIVNTIKSKK